MPGSCPYNSRLRVSEAVPLETTGQLNLEGIESAASRIELTVVDRAKFDQLVAERRGQVVLVDFWATWCLPCVQQFAHTVGQAEKNRDRGLAVVSVSMNDPTERDAIEAFLQRQKAGDVVNLVSEYGAGPQSMDQFDIAGGALPCYKLYDRAGKFTTRSLSIRQPTSNLRSRRSTPVSSSCWRNEAAAGAAQAAVRF